MLTLFLNLAPTISYGLRGGEFQQPDKGFDVDDFIYTATLAGAALCHIAVKNVCQGYTFSFSAADVAAFVHFGLKRSRPAVGFYFVGKSLYLSSPPCESHVLASYFHAF